ncbi:pol [Symbiodinium sp. CCMP2592]|nr:pol [Symbiodinium sp. CCMP2592]
MGATVQQHATRIDHLEACQKETTDRQDSTLSRLQALEKVVADLEKQQSRSPTPVRYVPGTPRGRGTSPRSPRGSRDPFQDTNRDPMQDLGLVVGGWTDARSHEAEEEVRNMFKAAQAESLIEQITGPSGRTNFLRVSLLFPENSSLPRKRLIQKELLDKLKAMKCTSGIEGQNDAELWIQKDRPIEERLRIRAVVLTKNFYNKLPPLAFETVTGRDKETLQQAWIDYGPASTPYGDLSRIWDVTDLPGTEVVALQELGGLPEKCPSSDSVLHHEVYLGGRSFTFFFSDPSHSFRGSAVGIPTEWVGRVEATTSFCTGLGIILKHQGVRQFIMTAHLPHDLRKDCLPVWQTQVEEILDFCSARRYHDLVCLCADLNYDILDIVRVDERGIPFGRLLRELGLSHSRPVSATWRNTRGASSRIDYFLFSLPSMTVRDDRVHVGSEEIVGSDHSAITLTLETVGRAGRRRFFNTRCGKWWVDAPQLSSKCEQLAEQLDLSMQDLTMQHLTTICQHSSKRITSCRYRDSPEIKQLIRDRKLLRGLPARQLAKRIADERKVAKREWLSDLLAKGAEGDFRALSYFKKRNSSAYTQGSYCMRAGGSVRAISDLRSFYRLKYTQDDHVPQGLALAIFRGRAGPIQAPTPFSLTEIQEVAFQCKHNKSTGADGISYEAIQLLLQTSLSEHLVELFNDVLWGTRAIPTPWLSNHVIFLPKTAAPESPKDLRPIVLSPTVAKVFTKALMLRLRPRLPRIQAFQVGGLPGRQTLDAACAVQHAIRLAQQYDKTLYVVKLDITAAFDSMSHEAVAAFLATATGCREAELLLEIIVQTKVELSLQGTRWEQPLSKGILQGSTYSAELFARVIDFFLTPTQDRWQDSEDSWLADETGLKLFLSPFADDLVLLGTSREQTQRLLRDSEETLQAIGLHFNAKKCKYLHSPGTSDVPFRLQSGQGIEAVGSMIFLGVLLGFHLSCVSVIAARMAKVSNAFWGYFRVLRQAGVGLTQRLRVFDCFITSRWRWMSPTARPLQTVRAYLKRAHTTFLSVILGFTRDPFQGSVDAWLSRRRTSRAAAQCVQHRRWEATQAQAFWTYWGHAARYGRGDRIPLRLMLQVRGPVWLLSNHARIRRARPGRAPDTSRFIQLEWDHFLQQTGYVGVALSWTEGAQDRNKWKDFISYWLHANSCDLTRYYDMPLEQLDLRGRMLLRNGDVFSLLPTRHVPVETAHPSSFLSIDLEPEARVTDPSQSEHLLRVFSDGSAPQGRHNTQGGPGGGAVVLLPPYGDIQDAIVSYFRIPGPCSNIEAEVRAAAHALKMIQEVRRRFPHLPVQFCTDSQYVLQVLNGDFIGTHHASATNDLLCRWSELSCYVQACHVRAHKGFLLNEVADHFAKKARSLGHSCTVYHTHNMSKAAVTPRHTGVFMPWLV